MPKSATLPEEVIQSKIFLIRGKKVMVDRDLAGLYEVSTKALNQAVKRNNGRFPADFIFQLSSTETKELVTNCDRFQGLRHSTVNPYAFTENGVAMLSSVLNSTRAIQINIQIMRTFTKLRELMVTHTELRRKIEELERKYDRQFAVVFDAIKRILEPPARPKRKIGFVRE